MSTRICKRTALLRLLPPRLRVPSGVSPRTAPEARFAPASGTRCPRLEDVDDDQADGHGERRRGDVDPDRLATDPGQLLDDPTVKLRL